MVFCAPNVNKSNNCGQKLADGWKGLNQYFWLSPKGLFMKRFAILLLIISAPVLYACKEKLVKYNDSGTTVTLMVDQVLKVELPADAGSGSDWREMRYDHVILNKKGKGNYVLGDGSSPGIYYYRFRAMVPGETHLVMEYGNKYDSDKKPTRVFELDVVVVPKH